MASRSYFGKMNSTLGSVVPLAMFFYICPDSAINCVFFIFVLIYSTTIDNDDTNANTETFKRQILLQCDIISTKTTLWLQNLTVNTMDWGEFWSSTFGTNNNNKYVNFNYLFMRRKVG